MFGDPSQSLFPCEELKPEPPATRIEVDTPKGFRRKDDSNYGMALLKRRRFQILISEMTADIYKNLATNVRTLVGLSVGEVRDIRIGPWQGVCAVSVHPLNGRRLGAQYLLKIDGAYVRADALETDDKVQIDLELCESILASVRIVPAKE